MHFNLLLVKVIEAESDVHLLKVDVDDFGEIAHEFGVRAMPTVVFLKDKEGNISDKTDIPFNVTSNRIKGVDFEYSIFRVGPIHWRAQ